MNTTTKAYIEKEIRDLQLQLKSAKDTVADYEGRVKKYELLIQMHEKELEILKGMKGMKYNG